MAEGLLHGFNIRRHTACFIGTISSAIAHTGRGGRAGNVIVATGANQGIATGVIHDFVIAVTGEDHVGVVAAIKIIIAVISMNRDVVRRS